MILKSSAFWFNNEYYRQRTSKAMGTQMAPNYSDLLYGSLWGELYCVTMFWKLDYHLWYGFVLLTIFSSYGPKIITRWVISFSSHKTKVYLSTNEVHFLDLTVSLKLGKLRITLFPKPTGSEFCFNTSSCHPLHVLKNIPKGQFIRLPHIC